MALYIWPEHYLTQAAQSMLDCCDQKFKEKEDKLACLEKAIKCLREDHHQGVFSHFLDKIALKRMKAVAGARAFSRPINKRRVPGYYRVIARPIDLATISRNVSRNKYQNREVFLDDVNLLLSNSLEFNGLYSHITETAQQMVNNCYKALEEYDEHLTRLEIGIAAVLEASLEERDLDITGPTISQPNMPQEEEDENIDMDEEEEGSEQEPQTSMLCEDSDSSNKEAFQQSGRNSGAESTAVRSRQPQVPQENMQIDTDNENEEMSYEASWEASYSSELSRSSGHEEGRDDHAYMADESDLESEE